MQKLEFFKLSPSGNPTILITGLHGLGSADRCGLNTAAVVNSDNIETTNTTDTPLESSATQQGSLPTVPCRLGLAEKLMHPLHLQAEQVGFINLNATPPRLDMMADEFCLNATRSLVFMMLKTRRFIPLAGTDDLFALARCSGMNAPLEVRVKNGKLYTGGPLAECSVTLPVALNTKTIETVETGANIICLPGIKHLLLDATVHAKPQTAALRQEAATSWREKTGLDKEAVCGVVWYEKLTPPLDAVIDPQKPTLFFEITPLVHVRDLAQTVEETACGSASVALALNSYNTCAYKFFNIKQPSTETLRLKLEQNTENLVMIEAGGLVRLIAAGETYII